MKTNPFTRFSYEELVDQFYGSGDGPALEIEDRLTVKDMLEMETPLTAEGAAVIEQLEEIAIALNRINDTLAVMERK